jgi:hypothetical protein
MEQPLGVTAIFAQSSSLIGALRRNAIAVRKSSNG